MALATVLLRVCSLSSAGVNVDIESARRRELRYLAAENYRERARRWHARRMRAALIEQQG